MVFSGVVEDISQLETDVAEGYLWAVELLDIMARNPDLEVKKELVEKAYETQFETILVKRGKRNIDDLSFSYALVDIRQADEQIKEAEELGYNVDTSITLLKEIVQDLYEGVCDDFGGSSKLLKFIENSYINFDDYTKNLEGAMPVLAENYSKEVLKRARKNAKHFKITRKRPVHKHRLRAYLEGLEPVKVYGVNQEDEITKILYLAYKKGVKYFIEEANKLPENDSMKLEYLKLAEVNEKYLNNIFQ